MCTDNAGKLLKTIQGWAAQHRVHSEPTIPYNSHMNGPAEQGIQVTEENTQCMLKDVQLSIKFWCEAAEASTYQQNCINEGPMKDGKPISAIEV